MNTITLNEKTILVLTTVTGEDGEENICIISGTWQAGLNGKCLFLPWKRYLIIRDDSVSYSPNSCFLNVFLFLIAVKMKKSDYRKAFTLTRQQTGKCTKTECALLLCKSFSEVILVNLAFGYHPAGLIAYFVCYHDIIGKKKLVNRLWWNCIKAKPWVKRNVHNLCIILQSTKQL